MSIARVTEIKASSAKSFDDAIKLGIARAEKTLTHVQSAWIENQEVLLGKKGQIAEYRVQMKVTFILEQQLSANLIAAAVGGRNAVSNGSSKSDPASMMFKSTVGEHIWFPSGFVSHYA